MKGKRIAVLEARLGKQLADLVAQKGGVPLHAPALAELPDLDPPAIAELVRSLEARGATLAIFQTGVGTRALFGATDGLYVRARGVPVYGVDGSWAVIPADERAHGRDERLPVRAFYENIDHWTDMIRRLAS